MKKRNWGGDPNLHSFILCLGVTYIKYQIEMVIINYNLHAIANNLL